MIYSKAREETFDERQARLKAQENQAMAQHSGGCGDLRGTQANEEYVRESMVRQAEYAMQELRQRALGAAISLVNVKDTPQERDWDVIIKAARAFLAFIKDG